MKLDVWEVPYSRVKHFESMAKRERVAFGDLAGCRWWAAFNGSVIIGAVGLKVNGKTARYRSDYVHPGFRRKGVYRALWAEREAACRRQSVSAFCTAMSLPMYLKHGFTEISQRNGITFVKRGPLV